MGLTIVVYYIKVLGMHSSVSTRSCFLGGFLASQLDMGKY